MGFYTIEHHKDDPVGREFRRDWYSLQDQLQSVEQALNVFGDAGETTRKATRFSQGEGFYLYPITHQVIHPVLGNTYIREAVDWMRAQAGAPAFGWVSVPPADYWPLPSSDPRSEKCGMNRRWINELRQAIGRISGGGRFKAWASIISEGQPPVVTEPSGRWLDWTYLNSDIYADGSWGATGQYGNPLVAQQTVFHSEGPHFIPPRPHDDSIGPLYEYETIPQLIRPATVRVQGIHFSGGTQTSVEMEDFEDAYSGYVQVKPVGATATSGSGLSVSHSRVYSLNQVTSCLRYLKTSGTYIADVYPGVGGPSQSLPGQPEQVNERTRVDDYEASSKTIIVKSSTSQPRSVSDVFGASDGLSGPFVWACFSISPSWADGMDTSLPLGGPEPLKTSGQGWVNGLGHGYDSETRGFEAQYSASRQLSGRGYAFFDYPIGGTKSWIYWTEEILPLAEGWPEDQFTYEA